MADVKWTFFADTAAAERAIQQLEQRFHKLENAQSQVGRKSKDSTSVAVAGLKSQLGSVVALGAGYLSLANVITTAHSEAQKVLKASDDIASRFDVAIRKIRIVGNLNEVQGEEAKAQIHAVSQRFGFTNEQGTDAARELTSAGFDVTQATGPALEALFKSLAANQKFDRDTDAGPLAKASASYLQSQNQALTGENLEKIGMMADKLGDVSTFAISDVEEIAKHGATMAGKLSQEEQFAATTHLITEGRPGSEAANALEKVTLSLTGKGDKKKTQEALKELGLETTDVDMIGESFLESLKKLDQGLKSVKPERQDTILTKLFGVEHISAAKSLITKNAKVEGLTKGLDDKAAFEEDVDIATGGRAAAGRRAQAGEEFQLGEKANRFADDDVLSQFRQSERERGISPLRTAYAEMGFRAFRSLGFDQMEALRGIARDNTQFDRVKFNLEEAEKPASQQGKTQPPAPRPGGGSAVMGLLGTFGDSGKSATDAAMSMYQRRGDGRANVVEQAPRERARFNVDAAKPAKAPPRNDEGMQKLLETADRGRAQVERARFALENAAKPVAEQSKPAPPAPRTGSGSGSVEPSTRPTAPQPAASSEMIRLQKENNQLLRQQIEAIRQNKPAPAPIALNRNAQTEGGR